MLMEILSLVIKIVHYPVSHSAKVSSGGPCKSREGRHARDSFPEKEISPVSESGGVIDVTAEKGELLH